MNWELNAGTPAPEFFRVAVDPATAAGARVTDGETAGTTVTFTADADDIGVAPPEWFTPDDGEDITEEEAAQRRDLPPLQKSRRFTARVAIEITIELWTWLADTGAGSESDWFGWLKYEHYRIGGSLNPLCSYVTNYLTNRKLLGNGHVRTCDYCPYKKFFGKSCNDKNSHLDIWYRTGKKNHAQAFLDELLQLQKAIILDPKSVLPGSQR